MNQLLNKYVSYNFFVVNIILIIKTITDNTTNYKSIISPWTN